MRIHDHIRQHRPVFSFEFFPPKTPQGEESLYRTLEHLRPLQPAFVSVTYGAGGTTRGKTVELVCRIKHELGIESMAHLTCVGAGREEIDSVLRRLRDAGIENILALRGDPPRQEGGFVQPKDGFAYASELVGHIRREMPHDFCIGGACYPEGHTETPDLATDLRHFVTKVDAGLDFAITQLFFDNADYFKFVARARARGVRIPIVPGIMPITNVSQIERFTAMCGAHIPDPLRAQLAAAEPDDEAVRRVGIVHAAAQCRELLERGVPGIHFYTLNQSPATRAILEQIRE